MSTKPNLLYHKFCLIPVSSFFTFQNPPKFFRSWIYLNIPYLYSSETQIRLFQTHVFCYCIKFNLILLDKTDFVVEWRVQPLWRPQQDLKETTMSPWLKGYYLKTRVLPGRLGRLREGVSWAPPFCNCELHLLNTDSY